MIEDIEGATSEPTRCVHVAVMSAATAAVALVLLLALVVPPSRSAAPLQAASPASSASSTFTTTFASSNPLVLSNPAARLPVDLSRTTLCADGTRLMPPYFLVFDATSKQIFAGPFDDGPRLPVPVTLDLDAGTGKVTVRCTTSLPQVVTGDMFGHQEFDQR
jgi:hypothetical protein